MITYSIIQKSQLEGALRLDAEYYQPEYLEVVEKLLTLPHKTLEDISESLLSFGAYSLTSFIQWEESGIPFITAEDVKDGFIDLESARFISEKVDEILKKSRVHENEVLLSMSGKVGDAAVAVNIPPRLNSNQDIVKIRLKKGYSSYYIAIFLNSKFGRLQVLRLPVGSVQQHIFLWQTKSLLIPEFSKEFVTEIENLYKLLLNNIHSSKILYQQAESFLLEELGLKDFKSREDLSFVVNLSEVRNLRRIDAEYFQPKYEEIVEAVKKYKEGFAELGNLVKIRKSIEPGSGTYQENGVPFVRVSNLSKFELSDNNQQFISKELYNELKTHQPEKGEILLSKDATPGVAYYLNEEPQKMIVSGGILRLKIGNRQVLPEYLTLVLNSEIVQKQMERDAGGSIINHWRPDQVRATIIPILGDDKQKEITELVEKSFRDRKLSKPLLEISKRGVEMAIEKNEEEAKKWIGAELLKLGIKL